jgi:mono/diheme cytochrome c family protein
MPQPHKRRTPLLLIVAGFAAATAAAWFGPSDPAAAEDQQPWVAPARASRKPNPIGSDDASLAAGKSVYVKECLQCHGDKGKGDGPASRDLNPKPHDLSDDAVVKQTDGALFWKLTEGRKPMPSYDKTLSEDQRWQVINYVRTLGKH